MQRASSLTQIPIEATRSETGETVQAWLSITELSAEETAGGVQLLADGIVSYLDDGGRYLAETFEDVPLTLGRAAEAAASVGAPGGLSLQRGPSEPGVCDILYLTLGPLNLDLLGLTVDLSSIELDLDAVAGAGNLLGNLLCAVTNLLNGGPLGAILSLLDQINGILDGINQLLANLPVVGSATSGNTALASGSVAPAGAMLSQRIDNGEFQGTLTVTRLAWSEDGGTLLADGILDGRARVDGKMRQVRDVSISGVPATLTSGPGGEASLARDGLSLQQAPSEPGVCDVLFLDLAPTYLDLLGLTVDLSQITLDVDAVPGGGNLLGNLLCAVTGLLDGAGTGGLGGLLQGLLQGVLDAVNQLLGGLSL